MSRYDVDKFVPPPDQELVCCICTNVLDEPMECPCRHVFCKVCIETWLNNKSNCPSCRDFVEKRDLKPVLPLVRNLLNKLTLMCLFMDNGCKDMITLEKYPAHVEDCGYEIVVCKYDKCSQTMLRKLIKVHEEQQCLHREIICKKKCALKIPLTEIDTHDCLEALKNYCDVRNKEIGLLQAELLVAKTKHDQLQKEMDKLKKELRHRRSWDSSSSSSTYSDNSVRSRSSRGRSRSISRSPTRSISRSPLRTDTSHDSFPVPRQERDEQEAILNSIATEQVSTANVPSTRQDVDDDEDARSEDTTAEPHCNTCQYEIAYCACPIHVERYPLDGSSSTDLYQPYHSDRSPSHDSQRSNQYHDSDNNHNNFSDASDNESRDRHRSISPDSHLSNSPRASNRSESSRDFSNHSEHDCERHNSFNSNQSSYLPPGTVNSEDNLSSSPYHSDIHERKRKRSSSSECSFSSRSDSESDSEYSTDNSTRHKLQFKCTNNFNKRFRSDAGCSGASTSHASDKHAAALRLSPNTHQSTEDDFNRNDTKLSLLQQLLTLQESDQSSLSDSFSESLDSVEDSHSEGSQHNYRRRNRRPGSDDRVRTDLEAPATISSGYASGTWERHSDSDVSSESSRSDTDDHGNDSTSHKSR